MRLYPPKVPKGQGVDYELFPGSGEGVNSAWFSGGRAAAALGAIAGSNCAGQAEILSRSIALQEQLNYSRRDQHYDNPAPWLRNPSHQPVASRHSVVVPSLPLPLSFTPELFSLPPTPPLSPSVSSAIANAARNQRNLEQVMLHLLCAARDSVTCFRRTRFLSRAFLSER
jgi:hypothetical protein